MFTDADYGFVVPERVEVCMEVWVPYLERYRRVMIVEKYEDSVRVKSRLEGIAMVVALKDLRIYPGEVLSKDQLDLLAESYVRQEPIRQRVKHLVGDFDLTNLNADFHCESGEADEPMMLTMRSLRSNDSLTLSIWNGFASSNVFEASGPTERMTALYLHLRKAGTEMMEYRSTESPMIR